ncbi:hypothetical protein RHMOL_Rhmol03G0148900 [Rhododendron molle]|uniref:Uncharacterized protein n=1 Tax=Rhododendron molle TaxID=49168 RepID=A0ACC0PFW7_RHOML|nr:hypothetical protein RHMOL_Rhmol03G0148900 [Rhododendron molle]
MADCDKLCLSRPKMRERTSGCNRLEQILGRHTRASEFGSTTFPLVLRSANELVVPIESEPITPDIQIGNAAPDATERTLARHPSEQGYWMEKGPGSLTDGEMAYDNSRIELKHSHQWFMDVTEFELFPIKKQAVEVPSTTVENVSKEDKKGSKKPTSNNFPSNVRSLLSTGMLDGVPVNYIAWLREGCVSYLITGFSPQKAQKLPYLGHLLIDGLKKWNQSFMKKAKESSNGDCYILQYTYAGLEMEENLFYGWLGCISTLWLRLLLSIRTKFKTGDEWKAFGIDHLDPFYTSLYLQEAILILR